MQKATLFILCICSLLSFGNNDKYRLIITDDPSTTIMIGWNQISGTSPTVYYGTTDFGTTWGSYPNSKTVDRTISYKGMTNTFAKLSGLTPDTNYYFVINDSQGTSQRFWFKTAPSTNDTMSFISGGDSRNNRTPRQNANKLVAKLKPTAVFFGGDMTNGDSSGEWQDWMDDWQYTTASDGRMFPIIPARGNHEASNNSIYDLFNVPSTNIYYKITFGTNLFSIYTLNSEITAGGSQYAWLQGELTTDNAIWKSAQYHKPMRPHESGKSEGNDEYNNWAQLFYDEGVRLVCESDSHTVKTTWPVMPCSSGVNCDEGFEREDTNGTVYVGEGCWGAPLRSNDDNKIWTRDSGSFNQFKWICVSTNQINIKTINVNNADSVGENSNTSVCELPTNINVWNPSNGDTVTIIDSALQPPSVSITSQTNNQYLPDGSNTTISANALDTDGTISYVEFRVNNTLIFTDSAAPFDTIYSFVDGEHDVETRAYDNDGLTDSDTVKLWVGTFSSQIDASANDDVEQKESDGSVYSSSSDLELVYDSHNSQGNQTIGIRFNNLSLPPNAQIDNAYVQFTADGNYSQTAELLVSVENSANASTFDLTNYNVTAPRTYYSSIYWSPAAWNDGDANAAQRTPNLTSNIQSIVNNASWSSGNAIVVKVEGTGVSLTDTNAKRRAESLDGLAAPILHVEYSVSPAILSTPAIEETELVEVFPNPVKNYLFLKNIEDNSMISLYTITGRKVFTAVKNGDKINLSPLSNGVYIMKVEHNNKVILTQKIVKKK